MKNRPKSQIQSLDGDSAFYKIAKDKGESIQALGEYRGIASRNNDFSNLESGKSSYPGLTQEGYYSYRPNESLPVKYTDIINRADDIYQKVGLIRNIIDLMSDFAAQDIRICHPNKAKERFFRSWWDRVNGVERSERFLNYLYRCGNVIVRSYHTKLKSSDKNKMMKAIADSDISLPKVNIYKKEIPIKYTFLNPATVSVVGGPLSSFVGNPKYAINIPSHIKKMINSPSGDEEKAIVAQLPSDIIDAAKSNKPYLLPQDRIFVYHYKKDDWQSWANPMIYAIMADIAVYNKLKLADMAALDGAISNIRIFNMGDLEHGIAPTKAAVARLAEILESHTGTGTMNIIWGPDLKLQESSTQVHHFLGEEKYNPTLNAIYSGLGIPSTLTGNSGVGTTNNFISLKTLIERLEYGRQQLINFWNSQIAIVQQAMDFKYPAQLEFGMNNLSDSASEKALLIQLADRNLISDELLQYMFGHNPDLESNRIFQENEDREKGKSVPKAGPFFDPQFTIALRKIALQSGAITPGEAGVEFDKELKNQKSNIQKDLEKAAQPPTDTSSGIPQQGRPLNSKDKIKRKTKTFKPKLKAAIDEFWTKSTLDSISDIISSAYLDLLGKKNLRMLSAAEAQNLEMIKFGVLLDIEPGSEIKESTVLATIDNPINNNILKIYNEYYDGISKELNRELTFDEIRQLQTHIYLKLHGEEYYGED